MEKKVHMLSLKKGGWPVSNHSYTSFLAVMFPINLQGKVEVLQVSHSDAAELAHWVVRGWSDQGIKERWSDQDPQIESYGWALL